TPYNVPRRLDEAVALSQGTMTMHSNLQKLVSGVVGLVLAASLMSIAQSTDTVIGTWKLISAKSTTLNGKVVPYAFGKTPSGFMTFTREGRMSLIMADDARKPLS